jgi:hypothetical protein
MGLLTWIFRLSGPTHGGPPIMFSESSQSNTHGTKPHQNRSRTCTHALGGLAGSLLERNDSTAWSQDLVISILTHQLGP